MAETGAEEKSLLSNSNGSSYPLRKRKNVLVSQTEEEFDTLIIEQPSSTTGAILRAIFFNEFIVNMIVSLRYIFGDVKSNRRNYVIAISTIFISVTLVIALSTAVSKTPLIFIKISENSIGEYDLAITRLPNKIYHLPEHTGIYAENNTAVQQRRQSSNNGQSATAGTVPVDAFDIGGLSSGALVNETYIKERLKNSWRVRGTTARWMMLGSLENRFDSNLNASVVVVVIDSDKEKEIGLGRSWTLPALGDRQTYVSSAVLRSIKVKSGSGEWARLRFDIYSLATTLGGLSPATLNATIKTALKAALNQTLQNISSVSFPAPNASVIQSSLEAVFGVPLPLFFIQNIINNSPAFRNGSVNIPVNVILNNPVLFDQVFDQIYSPESLRTFLNFNTEVLVENEFEKGLGKWPSALGNVIVLESKWILVLMRRMLPPAIRDNPIFIRQLLNLMTRNGGGGNSTIINTNSSINPGLNSLIASGNGDEDQIEYMLSNFPINQYAMLALVQMEDRISAYANYGKGRDSIFMKWTNLISDDLGWAFAATYTLPLQKAMLGADLALVFIEQLFLFITVFLLGLATIVIYSLLLSNVEEKTYEFGMLRTLGLKHNSLVQLLITQALFFSFPAVVLSVIAASLINIPTAFLIGGYSALPPDFTLTTTSLIQGLFLGIVIPLLGNIIPIRRALGRTLRDALDLYHFSANDTVVTIERLDSLGVDIFSTLASVILCGVGFICFYIIPWSFMFQYWGVFLGLLDGTVFGMVIGLASITIVIQPLFERLTVATVMWGSIKRLRNVVRKNLAAHRGRNSKTALMFTVIISFVIFSATMSYTQSSALTDNFKISIVSGADIVVNSFSTYMPLKEAEMRRFLQQQKDRPDGQIADFTFVTYPFHSYQGVTGIAKISSLIGLPSGNLLLYGVEENYMNAIFQDFFMYTSVDPTLKYDKTSDGSPDVVKSLYVDAGNATLDIEKKDVYPKVLGSAKERYSVDGGFFIPNSARQPASEAYSDYLDIIASTADATQLQLKMRGPIMVADKYWLLPGMGQLQLRVLAKPRAFVSKLSGFPFTWIPPLALAGQPALVSMPAFEHLLNKTFQSRIALSQTIGVPIDDPNLRNFTTPIDKRKVQIMMKSGAGPLDREFIKNSLKNFISDDRIVVVDTAEIIDSMTFATSMLELFFNVASYIAVVLCFFVLYVSFTANVRENKWEFGVLRAIGISKMNVVGIYVFEAISIFGSSLILGTMVGVVISSTLILQSGLFSQLPFTLYFPFTEYFAVVAMSITVTLLGSFFPAYLLSKKQIASTIKGK